ncbi:MAG: hypothetical protein KA792_04680 [Bacteroidales bacterium]|nr:hypothetical protein [Bacteroidales bacterium]
MKKTDINYFPVLLWIGLVAIIFFSSCKTYYVSKDDFQKTFSISDTGKIAPNFKDKYNSIMWINCYNRKNKPAVLALNKNTVFKFIRNDNRGVEMNLKKIDVYRMGNNGYSVYYLKRSSFPLNEVKKIYIKDRNYLSNNRKRLKLLYSDATEYYKKRDYIKRNGIWFNPSNANEINGLALSGFIITDAFNTGSLKMRGVCVNLEPEALFIVPMVTIYGALALFGIREGKGKLTDEDRYDELEGRITVTNSGLFISSLTMDENIKLNGLNITAINNSMIINGLSISMVMSSIVKLNGVAISGLYNCVTNGNGLQIGLTNYCKDCVGVQIGLWNRMGKRSLPIININFKRKNKNIHPN